MNMDRRRFLILSGGIAAIPSLRWTGVLAQDATPSASPVADPATMYGPVQGNSPYRLAYMQVFPDNPFWQTMNEAVTARAAENGVTVDTFALPTASGVADQVGQMEDAVSGLGAEPQVDVVLDDSWSTDSITAAGREKLRAAGFAPPTPRGEGPTTLLQLGKAVSHCPYCGSTETRLDNLFGPTPCRSVRYCTSCRQPYEQFKTI